MTVTVLVAEGLSAEDVAIEGDAYRHLFRSRRLAVGEMLRLTDGRGRAVWAEVLRVDRRRGILRPTGEEAPGNEATRSLRLAVATLKPERAAWLVEKGTELGVLEFVFFRCERAPREWGAATLDRLGRVAVAALEQCHRSRLPGISMSPDLDTVGAGLAGNAAYVLTPGAGSAVGGRAGDAFAVVGPEGGFTAEEQRFLVAAGAAPLGLGPSVLRVETAAVAAAVHLLHSP